MISNRWYGIVIDVALRFDTKGPKVEPLRAPPRIYRPCHRVEGRHSVRYAIVGVHWIVKAHWWWRWHRYVVEDYLFEIGWMEGDHPDAPNLASLKFGNPLRILASRIERIRAAAADARDYAVARAREEGAALGARMTKEQLAELRNMVDQFDAGRRARSDEAYRQGVDAGIRIARGEDLELEQAIADGESEGMPAVPA